jgi:hypothetical protein
MVWSELHFEYPWAFALLALAPFVFWMALRSYAYLGVGRRMGSAAVRVLALAVLATALAWPVVPEEDRRLCRAVAVDASLSVPGQALERALEFVRSAEDKRGDRDSLVVLKFSARPVFIDKEKWGSIVERDTSPEARDAE